MNASRSRRSRGFTLVELMVAVAVIGVLASIAYPSYTQYVVRTRRAAAAGCLLELAQFMERVWTTNLRYDQNAGAATALPGTSCRTDLAASYGFTLSAVAQRTFTLSATPTGAQATRDTKCATLRFDQTNTRAISGTGTVADCWK